MNKLNNQAEWRRTISAYDFALHEMVLYLDTHPDDTVALRQRDDYLQKRSDIVAQYEQYFGRYIEQPNDVYGTQGWEWVDNPWPWDYQ
jgi:spore coat protein JB